MSYYADLNCSLLYAGGRGDILKEKWHVFSDAKYEYKSALDSDGDRDSYYKRFQFDFGTLGSVYQINWGFRLGHNFFKFQNTLVEQL